MIVYYSNYLNQFVYDPEPLHQSFFDNKNLKQGSNFDLLQKCPAFIDYCKNTFVIRNNIDYDLCWDGSRIYTNYKDQEFYNKWVFPRSGTEGLVSYGYPKFLFFSEEPMKMELLPPFLHNVDVVKRGYMIPGVYNIGKHLRSLECAFNFHNKDIVKMKEGDPIYYVRFLTDKKIHFRKFFTTPELETIVSNILSLRANDKVKHMSFWYELMEKIYKKKILKHIRENLI